MDEDGNIMKDGVYAEGYQHECREPSRRIWEASLRSEEQVVERWVGEMGDMVGSIELRSRG